MDVFDSRSDRYRNPVGAVPAGEVVEITVRPESYRFPIRAFLCLEYEESGRKDRIEMTHSGSEGESEVFICSVDTSDYIGLIWFHFRFENEGGFFYYGNNFRMRGGKANFYGATTPPGFQITVYDGTYRSPEWFGEGICYHIFPDRFNKLETPDQGKYTDRSRIVREGWNETPYYLPESNGEVTNRDFFGGSLRGITEKLPYLESLGVSCIYLSPIFEAFSNHRYDTADYSKIDPMLGTEEDFKDLCRLAKERGIRIILDGVFNHTGYDSIYFNGLGRYGEVGAYQSPGSEYYDWYEFERWPDKYRSWWGIRTLPQVDESNAKYLDFIAKGDDSIVRRWIKAGASGWRLDVADELPDEFINEVNAAATGADRDAIIIGEVWEDASNKISYGKRRKYLLGGGLDGVTNYPFRSAVIEYIKGEGSGEFISKMEAIMENYPPYALKSAMNILGTHDTVRILSVLGTDSTTRERHQEIFIDSYSLPRAVRLLKMASLIQYTFIGTPCVYYGDEAGMEGFEDPLNRRGYVWGRQNAEILEWYRRLGAVRMDKEALRGGDLKFLRSNDDILAYVRTNGCGCVYTICNTSPHEQNIVVAGLKSDSKLYDLMMGQTIHVSTGGRLTIPPETGLLLEERY